MMKATRQTEIRIVPFLLLWISLLLGGSAAAALKVKVMVDNATIKATPEIGSRTLANVPLDTVLEVELKQGEWYKVSMTKEGATITGYIHELLVQEAGEGEESPTGSTGGLAKTQAEIVAEIELKVEESRNLIRQERDLEMAADNLRPLLARAFTVEDRQRQKQIACEIYLWLGLAAAQRGDQYGALKEFRSMFDVDYALAKNVTRNIFDPVVGGFIEHAEKLYRGLIVDYTYEIVTDPKEAVIRVNGQEIGLSPEVYRTAVPKFTLEIEKEGYRPVKEEVFLAEANSKKEITLQSSGRTVVLGSVPSGAQVFLDDVDTGKVTACELPYVPYGGHLLKLKKEHWADHEEAIEVLEGEGPLAVTVRLTVQNYVLGQKMGGPESKSFKLPKAITFDREGNLYVADESEVKLKKYNAQGHAESGWGGAGREFRMLKEPAGIAVDGQGFVYVTDAKSGCVLKFAADGKFVAKWGKEGSKPGELNAPLGLAVDRTNDIYVADSGNNRIVKYSTGGVVKKVWGKQGTGQGDFLFPTGVAVNRRNEVIVVDRTRVQKFSPEGQIVAAWGKPGGGDGELNRPLGLAVDALDYVYVADTGNNRIQKFSADGKFITKWGAAGPGDGQMTSPRGVAVNAEGSVLVVEAEAGRIQEFRVPSQ